MKVPSGHIPVGTPWPRKYWEQVIISLPWKMIFTMTSESVISAKFMPRKCMCHLIRWIFWLLLGLSQCGTSIWWPNSADCFQWTSFYPGCHLLLHQMGRSCIVYQRHQICDYSFHQQNIICRYKVPEMIISDNWSNLNNKMLKKLCDSFKIKYYNSSPYRLKMNGVVEAANKNIKKIVQKMVVTYKD